MVLFCALTGPHAFTLCREELEHMWEEGVSLEELKEKRDQFAEKLINLRRKLDVWIWRKFGCFTTFLDAS